MGGMVCEWYIVYWKSKGTTCLQPDHRTLMALVLILISATTHVVMQQANRLPSSVRAESVLGGMCGRARV